MSVPVILSKLLESFGINCTIFFVTLIAALPSKHRERLAGNGLRGALCTGSVHVDVGAEIHVVGLGES